MGVVRVDLSGKVALVTGAGKGMGREFALSLAKSGAMVAATSRTMKDLESLKAEIEASGGKCFIITCDVLNINQIYEMVENVSQWGERIDILVNNSGVNWPQEALDVGEEQWDLLVDTNLKGAFFCAQAVAKKMIPNKYGKIINITSQIAFVGLKRRAVYCATKGGLTTLSKTLAIEWAPYNIQVNNIAPTFISTALTAPALRDPKFRDEVISKIPLGRIGEPKDITGAVLFLASDSSDMMTGSTILVDGGWLSW